MTALFGLGHPLSGQSCSCGGAPMLGSLGSIPLRPGQWQLETQYDYNDISGIASGSEILPGNDRRQLSRSTIMRLNYGLSRSVLLSAILTAVAKERVVSDVVRTAGIGDGIVLVQINLLPELGYPQRDFLVGVGLKAPLGRADLTRNGIRISPDMQPTSGGWDGLASLYISSDIFPPHPATLLVTASHRWTSANRAYSTSQQDYRFGNETVANIGINYFIGLNTIASLQLNYRHTEADRLGKDIQPNSGGQWLFVAPGMNFRLMEKMSIGVAGQLPIYFKLNGAIQLTTRYSFSLSAHYTFGGPGRLGSG